MKLSDLLAPVHLDDMLTQGYVRKQAHPSLPLAILNYTEAATYERVWNDVTMQCRGLIYNTETGEIAARPFRKFMNYGEPGPLGDIELDPNEPVVVTDKLDGSLGVLYDDGDGGAIATRGSFTSEQAIHATRVWKTRYTDAFPHQNWTFLFEIIYPSNRIVCDYGDVDDLYLLALVGKETGEVLRPTSAAEMGWSGPIVERFSYASLAEALEASPRDGAEGLVIDLVDRNERIKLKQADYIQLHKLITGLNERSVWEHLGAGGTVAELCAPIPDEFHDWITKVAARLTSESESIVKRAETEHALLMSDLPVGWTRKDYALRAITSPSRAVLFQLLDGRDPRPDIWRTLRPSGAVTMTGYSEDVA